MPTARAMATSDFSVRVRSETRLRGVDVGGDPLQRRARRLGNRRPIDQAPFALEALDHGDIFGDRHPFDQAEILVDEGDRWTAALEIMKFAVDADLAAIGLHHAGQDLHRVDLPAPFWPSRARISPRGRSRSTSHSAWVAPNDFERPRIVRAACAEGAHRHIGLHPLLPTRPSFRGRYRYVGRN